ncbi:transcriptional repressor LexA [bacterium M00.F.Ca.ET.228.01.1.1]|uniref:LexA repressor n=1 Tax=Burkholderia sp. (strain CCGE1003) TaxID=640512 RepID=E1T6N2_BURSG|nr:transcriptional repressor LexA [Paraburkholderia phenoliruptrix]MBW9130700.1 transcriptional repressor LexA [Paraburkholderia ginsengiterrae]TGP42760.1 transcriptional repressor LexA [bacterium M00.F.Ca.ET.228.01.1.1]TGR98951.1 transcriptional repressor LexA [bacterium M00.F.Ca.ET.191.01.1.1]TGU03265.1 transcriptional repressor LexA [bacterium M00.F.Ca.ET.155.01.1.1]MBW0447328.1 transcriptional repressor LexA [Paraburkholderia phenoliruptrix]
MTKLTARQQQVFDLIRRAIERTGFPPTRAEIAAELGFSSANSAEEHLRALARKGVIELAAGASRGIRLVPPPEFGQDGGQHQFTLPHPALMQLSLPLVGRVAAGSPILAQEHIAQHYACDPALFSSKPDYLLKVRGLSMRDAGIFDGDLLAVQKRSEAKDGQIIIARLGDDVTVKRLKRRPNGIELIAENPDYENIFVETGSADFALEGIAVGLIRPGEF